MQRWDAVPDTIKEEIISETNADFVWKVCEDEHLPENKKRGVARITSYVVLGFIHPGDLAREIADELSINQKIADAIAEAINTRIFIPLGNELNSVYEPPSKLEPLPVPLPQPLEDVKKPGPVLSEPPRFAPPPSPPKPPTPPPFGTTAGGPPAPFGSAMPRPATPPPFGAAGSKPPTPFAPGTTPTGKIAEEKEPAPKIIQEEVEFRPLRQPSGFGINIPMPKSLDANLEKAPVKPAVLEFSATNPPQAQKQMPATGPGQQTPRVVHYSEYRTPVDALAGSKQNQQTGPGQNAAAKPQTPGRDVQEITATPSSIPTPQRSYGSTARPPMPAPMPPPPQAPPAVNRVAPPKPPFPTPPPIPSRPQTPSPKFSDVLLNEKELPPGK